jgi:dethiobiotin synthetase
MPAIWIAGAGTDIGKTYVAAALLSEWRRCGLPVDAFKPVASGYADEAAAESDAGRLLAAMEIPVDRAQIERICPLRFAAPLSPPLAARLERRRIDFDDVVDRCQRTMAAAGRQRLLIETAGGVMSPLDDDHTMLDLMTAVPARVVLVAGSYLGAISHTLTALTVLRGRGLEVGAIAISESEGANPPLKETEAALARLAGATPIVPFARNRGAGAAAALLAAHLDRSG